MSTEEFEKQLQQRPVRQVSAAWQAKILSAAKAAAGADKAPTKGRVSIWANIRECIAALLELRPKALAGLAAAWLLIFTLHFSTHDESQVATSKDAGSRTVLAVREQRLFLAELIGARETRDAEPPKRILPGPRSEAYDRTATV